ncbi:MAG: hypothetical protein JNK11_14425, partial [Alphaproteobacteria bacterium]|nr:hypothetical protein [Alphaproteobacteria bacterium]
MAKRRARSKRERPAETSLYGPVKAFLERQAYEVKGEIGSCDIVARRGDEPLVVVELKTAMSMELLLQGVDRLSITDAVYVAVPSPRGASAIHDRRLLKLLRRIGVGLLTVDLDRNGGGAVEVVLDPVPYRPRADRRRAGRLLGEFARRVGDPSAGGSARVKIVTAYRQECLRLA